MRRLVKFKYLLILVLGLFLTVSLYSCGGGGGGSSSSGGNSGGGGTPSSKLTPITTKSQAQSVASSSDVASGNGIKALSLVSNVLSPFDFGAGNDINQFSKSMSSETGQGLANIVLIGKIKNSSYTIIHSGFVGEILKKVKNGNVYRSAINETDACDISGSYSINGTFDDQNGYYDVTLSYDNCSDNGEEYLNGSIAIKGTYTDTEADFTAVTDKMSIYDADSAITTRMDNVKLSVKGKYDDKNESGSLNLSINGDIKTVSSSAVLEDMQFANFDMNFEFTNDGDKGTLTVNGEAMDSLVSYNESVDIKYDNFVFNFNILENEDEEYSIDGSYTISYLPPNFCPGASGTYEFVTDEPIYYNSSADMITRGKITINGTEVITWNSDGTVTVTLNGNTIYTGSEDDFFDVDECQLPDTIE